MNEDTAVGWNAPALDPDAHLGGQEWHDEEADVDDGPRRPRGHEHGCGDDSGSWFCERQKGHSGPHMAWSDYPNRVLYERGEWA